MAISVEKFDVVFQRKTLRVLIQDRGFLELMADHLPASFFDDPVQKWFARTAYSVYRRSGTKFTDTVFDIELQRAVAAKTIMPQEEPKYRKFLGRLFRPVPEAAFVRDEVYKFIKRQKQQHAIYEAATMFEQGKATSEEIDTKMMASVMFTPKTADSGSFFGKTLKDRIKRRKLPVVGIPTGIESLDETFDAGGLPPKFLGVVIAPPGKGKTAILVSFGAAALRMGFKVLHYTLELPKEMIEDRYDSCMTSIRLGMLRSKPKTLKRLLSNMGPILDNLVIKEEAEGELSVNHIRSHLRHLETLGFVPDLLIIDYADEMKPCEVTRDEDGTYHSQGKIYQEINALLKEKNLRAWTASQTTRSAMAKEDIDLDDFGDSWNKAKKAYYVCAAVQTKKEAAKRKMRLVNLKNRGGKTGRSIVVSVDWSRVLMTESALP